MLKEVVLSVPEFKRHTSLPHADARRFLAGSCHETLALGLAAGGRRRSLGRVAERPGSHSPQAHSAQGRASSAPPAPLGMGAAHGEPPVVFDLSGCVGPERANCPRPHIILGSYTVKDTSISSGSANTR